jgi:hypothetical protein
MRPAKYPPSANDQIVTSNIQNAAPTPTAFNPVAVDV